MIAVDTSSLVAFFNGVSGIDVDELDHAFDQKLAILPPVVLTELLSIPQLPEKAKKLVNELPLLELMAGFWQRAGRLRSRFVSQGLKARLADSLIAQSCIDHDVALITRDRDFRHFDKLGLKLIVYSR